MSMEQIRIKTPQNVTISYDLAAWYQRMIAFLLDAIFLWILCLGLAAVISGFDSEGYSIFILVLFYTLINETLLQGSSLGKLIVGLKVVRLDGTKVSFSDLFIRWIFRCFDIWLSVFSVAIISNNLTENRQRLGDILAGTTVVSTKYDDKKLSLAKIKSKNSLEKYEQKYDLIKSFSEEEMVLVKNCLYRKRKYNNKAHLDVFNEMVLKVAKRLELRETPKDKELFVRSVIRDYVLANR
jgi:uncharacterized RDD family membrane protein YckC